MKKKDTMRKIIILLTTVVLSMTAKAQNTGYEKSIEINGGPAMNDCTKYSLGISMVNGYRIIPNLYAGIGVGFRYTDALFMHTWRSYMQYGSLHFESRDSYSGDYLLPIFARIQYNFTTTKFKPMLLCDAGYTINVGSVEGNAVGFYWEPAFGVDISLEEKTSLYFQIGINMQSMHYDRYEFDYYDGANTEEIKTTASTLCFKIGMRF